MFSQMKKVFSAQMLNPFNLRSRSKQTPTKTTPTTTSSKQTRLEDFELGGLLGEGAHGFVWSATKVSTGERVALKQLDLSKSTVGKTHWRTRVFSKCSKDFFFFFFHCFDFWEKRRLAHFDTDAAEVSEFFVIIFTFILLIDVEFEIFVF